MLERANDIVMLLKKQLNGELSEEEKLRLEDWANESEANRRFYVEMTSEDDFIKSVLDFNKLVDTNTQKMPAQAPVVGLYSAKTSWRFYVAAASVLLILMASALFLYNSGTKKEIAKSTPAVNPPTAEIPPAGNKAILTLSDGRKISLSDAANGMLTKDGSIVINKKQDGELIYESNPSNNKTQSIAYNTISSPKGGKYQVVLPDGSKVWINAATSIRFPVAFSGNERSVELSGEAYFEIKKDPSKPFKVFIGSPADEDVREIEVLGTHFNVNAYEDEAQINATLLEGSIKFTTRNTTLKPVSKVLTPGQRALVAKKGNDLVVSAAKDPQAAVAWVNGQFSFEKTNLKAVMRELSRWYDVQVTFDDDVAMNTLFTGKVDRTIPLARLLSNLEKTGDARFELKGRTVKVSVNP
jgi:transmembrane sensor